VPVGSEAARPTAADSSVDRLTWLVLALVLLLGGVYLHVHLAGDWLAYLVAGVGAGIGLALVGSVIHDAFAGQRQGH
jgi:hypothetical protein